MKKRGEMVRIERKQKNGENLTKMGKELRKIDRKNGKTKPGKKIKKNSQIRH